MRVLTHKPRLESVEEEGEETPKQSYMYAIQKYSYTDFAIEESSRSNDSLLARVLPF